MSYEKIQPTTACCESDQDTSLSIQGATTNNLIVIRTQHQNSSIQKYIIQI